MKKTYLSTIEGIFRNTILDLNEGQIHRKDEFPEAYEKICLIVSKIEIFLENPTKFTIIIDDPSGNSYIENLLYHSIQDLRFVLQFVHTFR